MAMVKIKVAEAGPKALDWLVAKCEGYAARGALRVCGRHVIVPNDCGSGNLYSPTADWSQGGPIKEREAIATRRIKGEWYAMRSEDIGDADWSRWVKFTFKGVPKTASTSRQCQFDGPTELVAAMRCHVAFNLGPEVEVPEELL